MSSICTTFEASALLEKLNCLQEKPHLNTTKMVWWHYGSCFVIEFDDGDNIEELSGFLRPFEWKVADQTRMSDKLTDEWTIFAFNCYLDGFTCHDGRLQSNDITVVTYRTGACMITQWSKKRRWHFQGGANTRQFVQDIYCGIRRVIGRQLMNLTDVALLHAAAVSLQDHTVLIAGHKGVGKSSLINYLLFELGAQLISDDKTYCWTDKDEGIVCAPLLSSIKVTLEKPALVEANNGAYANLLSIAESKERKPGTYANSKVSLSPLEFSCAGNIRLCSSGIPEAVVILDMAYNGNDEVLEPIQAIEKLSEYALQDAYIDCYMPSYMIRVQLQKQTSLILQLAYNVRCYTLPYHPNIRQVIDWLARCTFNLAR